MRILLLNTSFPPQVRSAASLFHELGVSLTERGHSITVVTEIPWRRLGTTDREGNYRRAGLVLRETMDGMQIIRVKGFTFRETSMAERGINALFIPMSFWIGARMAGKQDVALVYSPPLTAGLAAILYSRLNRVPFIFGLQDIYPQTAIELGLLKNPLIIRMFEWVEALVYLQADKIVVYSEGNRDYLVDKRAVSAGKIAIIPNWVDVDAIRPSDRLNSFRQEQGIGNHFVVSYAGTMGYAQDLSPVLEAAHSLRSHPDILFLLVGEGAREQEWKAKSIKLGLTNVRFLPLQRKSIYPSLIAASDVGLVPLIEGLQTPTVPRKLLDLMGGGRPIIAIVDGNGDAAKIVETAKAGYIIMPGDSHSLTQAILALHNQPALARTLGENGRAYAETHFSRKSCIDQYETLFQEIVKQSQKQKLN